MNLDDAQIEVIKKQFEQLKLALKLCKDLLDPDVYGMAVPAEVRNRARVVFGIEATE